MSGQGRKTPIEQFLEWLRPEGPWHLSAFDPEGGPCEARSFTPDTAHQIAGWIERNNLKEKRNIYFTPNRLRPEAASKMKPTKADIEAVEFAHVDLDVPKNNQKLFLARPFAEKAELFEKQLDRLVREFGEKLAEPGAVLPSVTWKSGGGMWALWRLAEPLSVEDGECPAARAANEALIELLDPWADKGTHNIDRIARLPGTVNWPNKKKREQGRAQKKAGNPEVLGSSTTDPAALIGWAEARAPKSKKSGRPDRATAGSKQGVPSCPDHPLLAPFDPADMPTLSGDVLEDLAPYGLSDRTLRLIANWTDGLDPEDVARKQEEADTSPSGLAWEIWCEFARRGVPVTVAVAVAEYPDWAVWNEYFGRPEKKLKRTDLLREFANAVERVAAEDAQGGAGTPFWGPDAPPGGDDGVTPRDGFRRDPKSKAIIRDSQHNMRHAIAKLGVRLSFDEFANKLLIEGFEGEGPEFDDGAEEALWLAVHERWFKPERAVWEPLTRRVARENRFHPVLDFLDALPQWDRVERLDTWLTEYGAADDTAFVRAAGALTLIAAVRRVRQPGCKFDEMLVLESPEGFGKSTAIATLLPTTAWFSDSMSFGMEGRETLEAVTGKWIIEVAELKGLRKSEVEARKAFLSRTEDRGRLAYARNVSSVPRCCVFIGTTNDSEYLGGTTGNRRFWPVKVGRFDLDRLAADRDQLWAEAAHREAAGESIRLDPALWDDAKAEQDARLVGSAVLDRLEEVLCDDDGNPCEGKITAKAIRDILGIDANANASANQKLYDDMGAAMQRLGWKRATRQLRGRKVRCYVRGEREVWWSLRNDGRGGWYLVDEDGEKF